MNVITPADLSKLLKAKETSDEYTHFTCHCTDDMVSACGLDVSDLPWNEDEEDGDYTCPLCLIAWPEGSVVCPWGCPCTEDCVIFIDF